MNNPNFNTIFFSGTYEQIVSLQRKYKGSFYYAQDKDAWYKFIGDPGELKRVRDIYTLAFETDRIHLTNDQILDQKLYIVKDTGIVWWNETGSTDDWLPIGMKTILRDTDEVLFGIDSSESGYFQLYSTDKLREAVGLAFESAPKQWVEEEIQTLLNAIDIAKQELNAKLNEETIRIHEQLDVEREKRESEDQSIRNDIVSSNQEHSNAISSLDEAIKKENTERVVEDTKLHTSVQENVTLLNNMIAEETRIRSSEDQLISNRIDSLDQTNHEKIDTLSERIDVERNERMADITHLTTDINDKYSHLIQLIDQEREERINGITNLKNVISVTESNILSLLANETAQRIDDIVGLRKLIEDYVDQLLNMLNTEEHDRIHAIGDLSSKLEAYVVELKALINADNADTETIIDDLRNLVERYNSEIRNIIDNEMTIALNELRQEISVHIGSNGIFHHALATGDVAGFSQSNFTKVEKQKLSQIEHGARNLIDSISILIDPNSSQIQREALTGDVTASKNSNITSIAPNAITGDKIKNGAIVTDKINNDAITTEKIKSGSITNIKLDRDSVDAEKIVNNAVTTEKINDNAVITEKIKDRSVTTEKIADLAITITKLAIDSISTEKIIDKNITNEKLSDMIANTIKGRVDTNGEPQDLTSVQIRSMLNVEDGSNHYVHEKHTARDETTSGSSVFSKIEVNEEGHVVNYTTRKLEARDIITQSESIVIDPITNEIKRAALTGDVISIQDNNETTIDPDIYRRQTFSYNINSPNANHEWGVKLFSLTMDCRTNNNGAIACIEITYNDAFWQGQQRGYSKTIIHVRNAGNGYTATVEGMMLGILRSGANDIGYGITDHSTDGYKIITFYAIRTGGNTVLFKGNVKIISYTKISELTKYGTIESVSPNPTPTVIPTYNLTLGSHSQFVKGDGSLNTINQVRTSLNVEDGANHYVHPNSGATVGTYRSVTINAQGHITNGTNPTTLTGYGITDAASKTHTHNYAGSDSPGGAATNLLVNPIAFNVDLNTVTTAGFYNCEANSIATTLQNCPTSNAFFLTVGRANGTTQELVEYMSKNPKRYMRNYFHEWGDWYEMYTSASPQINITGNAATATTATNLSFFKSTSSVSVGAGVSNTNAIGYINDINLFGQTDGGLFKQVLSNAYLGEIFVDYRTGQLASRGKNNGVLQPWRVQLDSDNYNTYCPTRSGEGASGTWGINITGSSASTTKANQDHSGQVINSTYIKGLSASGKTITYTKGNGTTGTILTQDTVYTHPNHTGDITSTGDGNTVIGNGKVTNAKLALIPVNTLKGSVPGASTTDLKPHHVREMLGVDITDSNRTGQTGSVETYTIPSDGVYLITAAGAAGSASDSRNRPAEYASGGAGALISARFRLKKNDRITILTGKMGHVVSSTSTAADATSGAGGGGTFIFKEIPTIVDSRYQFFKAGQRFEVLLVAAGGGGTNDLSYKLGEKGSDGIGSNWYSPTNYIDPTTQFFSGVSSSSVSIGGSINQYISYNGVGNYYARNGNACYGGYGGGAASDDANCSGGGWYNADAQSRSWSSGVDTKGITGFCKGSGFVKIINMENPNHQFISMSEKPLIANGTNDADSLVVGNGTTASFGKPGLIPTIGRLWTSMTNSSWATYGGMILSVTTPNLTLVNPFYKIMNSYPITGGPPNTIHFYKIEVICAPFTDDGPDIRSEIYTFYLPNDKQHYMPSIGGLNDINVYSYRKFDYTGSTHNYVRLRVKGTFSPQIEVYGTTQYPVVLITGQAITSKNVY